MTSIHQFVPVTSRGDGVSGSAFLIQTLLRSLGYSSEIYSWKTSKELEGQVLALSRFHSEDCDLLLVHHSMGHDQGAWIESTLCPRILIYHNITPSKYFQPNSSEYYYSIEGREQLQKWRSIFLGAISVSPYNLPDLEEAGYEQLSRLLSTFADLKMIWSYPRAHGDRGKTKH
jgi:hypothetical protein